MKHLIKKFAYSVVDIYKRCLFKRNHSKELKKYLKATKIQLKHQEHETEFLKNWSQLMPNGKINLGLYRFYAHYLGDDSRIITDDVFHITVEPCLNCQGAISVYGDKNMFERILPQKYFPVCILRNMEYDYLDRDYHIIQMDNVEFEKRVLQNESLCKEGKLIVKPAKDTGGGLGVRLFTYNANDYKWVSNEGETLTLDYLEKKYKRNFIIQKTLEPCEFVKQFNPTSYSTFRVFTYRSVMDDKPHFIGGYLRIGAKDCFKDNIWGGGYAIPININGTLSDFASDAQRKRYDSVNGINLKEKEFAIPNWNRIIELCYDIATKVTPNRLLSFDIILDDKEEPRCIEFNSKNQTVTTVQTTSKPFFGEYTTEVISYCKSHLKKRLYLLTLEES